MTNPEMDRAATLHAQAIIIDGHNDALMAVADGKTSLLERVELPDPATWKPPFGMRRDVMDDLYGFSPHTTWFQTVGFYDVPRALAGGVTAQAFSVYLADLDLDRALHRTMDMISGLYAAADVSDQFAVVTSVAGIREVKAAGITSGYLTFEGLEPLGYSLNHLPLFHHLGLRMATLSHSRRNAFADGNGQPGGPITGGLTHLGREAVQMLNKLGIVIDLAHMNLRGAWEIMELTDSPVVISHAMPEQIQTPPSAHPSESDLRSRRQLWEVIARNGGVIGAIAYSRATLAEFVDGIDGIVAAVGIEHVGLGTDYFGLENAPAGFQGLHETPNLTAELVRRGYPDDAILKILGGNYLRLFELVWGG